MLRAGLKAILASVPELECVGEAATGTEAVELVPTLKPDLVLLDLSMPGPGGMEVCREIKRTVPETKILILTMYEDHELVREAIRSGASGYIIKRAAETELATALDAVMRGEIYVHPAVTRGLFDAPEPADREGAGRGDRLTRRESEVLRLIAEGYTNAELAEQLGIGLRTVETHRANLVRKLGTQSRAELVRYARNAKLIPSSRSAPARATRPAARVPAIAAGGDAGPGRSGYLLYAPRLRK
ncbi:MAG: response regulator transcription factor [Gemmatimonadota bacterium]